MGDERQDRIKKSARAIRPAGSSEPRSGSGCAHATVGMIAQLVSELSSGRQVEAMTISVAAKLLRHR